MGGFRSPEAIKLRMLAEERLRDRPAEASRSPVETVRLLHELQVHQIELEMQNEELSRSRAEEEMLKERYADFHDFAPTGFVSLNRAGEIIQINPMGALLLGAEPAQLGGANLPAFLEAADRPAFTEFLRALFTTGGRKTLEVRRQGLGSTPVLLHIEATLARDQQECRAVLVDLRERQRAEEELRNLNESLERRVAERTAESARLALKLRALAGELSVAELRERRRLAIILHDHLQQLLVAAKIRLELAASGAEGSPGSREPLIQAIIQEAIDVSRDLTVELSPPILNHGGLIQALGWLIERFATKSLFEVQLQADPGAEPGAEPVRLLLFEAVRELLLNAIKHSGCRKATVTLRRNLEGLLEVTVEDNGVGFEPLALKRGDGQGSGLFSIQQRLLYLGGDMAIHSAPGQGARVTLLAPPEGSGPGEVIPLPGTDAEEAFKAMALPSGRAKIHLLVVDDHKILREGLRALLQIIPDFEVVGEAEDGIEGLERVRQVKPDLVITDLVMPRMNGLEFTRILLRDHPGIKVIGLSMANENARAAAMREAGATGFLTKDGPFQELVDAIRLCVAHPELPWVT